MKKILRRKHSSYIEIKKADHPFANSMGYILEHRFVIEEYLKKNNPNHPCLIKKNNQLYLSRGWQVHHKDRNKQNNKAINLLPVKDYKHYEEHVSMKCPHCKKKFSVSEMLFKQSFFNN